MDIIHVLLIINYVYFIKLIWNLEEINVTLISDIITLLFIITINFKSNNTISIFNCVNKFII